VSLPFWRGGGGQLWLLALLPAGLALLHPRALGATLAALARRLGRPELAWRYSYTSLLLLVGLYTLANLAAGLALAAILRPLAPLGPGVAAYAVGAWALAWAAGFLSLLTPSGLGVREAVLTALLAQIVPLPAAVAASLLHRLALTLGEALAAGALLLLRRRP
jgi:glycosyltransferase 2 family protein